MKTQTILVCERDGLKAAQKYLSEANISEENRDIIREYLTALMVGDGNKVQSPLTVRAAIFTVKSFTEIINKPLRSIEKYDIMQFLAIKKQKGLSPSTIGFYAIRLRQFFIWLDKGKTEKISWIKKVKTKKDLQESDLILPSEIMNIVSIADNLRDKTLISGLYESACRISEWLNIRIKDILFDDYGAKVKVDGKTGPRTIRLIDSVPYLTQWINTHPYKDNKEAYVFINFSSNYYGRRLHMATVGNRLRMYAKRTGLGKYIHPHLLRHSRLTWLAKKEGFNERDLRIFAGWSSTSDMPDTYIHYGADEVDRKLRLIKGLEDGKDKKQDMIERKSTEPKICPRCKTKNPATALYCNCGMGLDIKVLQEEIVKRNTGDEILDKIINDPELSKGFAELIQKAQLR